MIKKEQTKKLRADNFSNHKKLMLAVISLIFAAGVLFIGWIAVNKKQVQIYNQNPVRQPKKRYVSTKRKEVTNSPFPKNQALKPLKNIEQELNLLLQQVDKTTSLEKELQPPQIDFQTDF